MFRTEFDEGQLLLISEIWGFWTLETVSAYRLDIAEHVRRVRLHHSFFRMLCRGTDMSVQAPEVVDAMTRFSSELTTLCPGPIAVVTGSMLNKMQVSRSGSHERFRAFLEEQQARSWLFGYVPADDRRGLTEP